MGAAPQPDRQTVLSPVACLLYVLRGAAAGGVFTPIASRATVPSDSDNPIQVPDQMNFRAILVTLAVLGTLTGCRHSRPVYLTDVREGHYVNCSTVFRNWGSCYETASKVCGASGYEIVERIGDSPQAAVSQCSGVL